MNAFQQQAAVRFDLTSGAQTPSVTRTLISSITDAHKALGTSADLLAELMKRLEPVLRPDTRTIVCEVETLKSAIPDSPAVEQVDSLTARVSRIEGVIANALARLTL